MRFFPEPDSSEIAPFTHAFLHMMFAHVEFERRIADLAVVITLDPGFGETKATIWSAKERPEKFDKLCSDNQSKHPGGLPEADAIVRCVSTRRYPSARTGIGWPTASGGDSVRTSARSTCTPCAFEMANR